MARMRTTLLLERLGTGAGSAPSIEALLGRVAGVHRVYVHPAMEVAYVEHDVPPDRAALARVIESAGVCVVAEHHPSRACHRAPVTGALGDARDPMRAPPADLLARAATASATESRRATIGRESWWSRLLEHGARLFGSVR